MLGVLGVLEPGEGRGRDEGRDFRYMYCPFPFSLFSFSTTRVFLVSRDQSHVLFCSVVQYIGAYVDIRLDPTYRRLVGTTVERGCASGGPLCTDTTPTDGAKKRVCCMYVHFSPFLAFSRLHLHT